MLVLLTFSMQAQVIKKYKQSGFEGTYGARIFHINSSIEEISNVTVLSEGGGFGIIDGNEFIKVNFRIIGFNYSSMHAKTTVDLIEAEYLVNLYPFKLNGGQCKLKPYVLAGATYDYYKFRGYYAQLDPVTNYSVSEEPVAGVQQNLSASIGIGTEYYLYDDSYTFVALIAEAKYGQALFSKVDSSIKDTSVNGLTSFSIGVRFGGWIRTQ